MNEITVGSVVVLKSNPDVAMTVESIEHGKVNCTWLDKSRKQADGIFSLTSLEIYEDPIAGLMG